MIRRCRHNRDGWNHGDLDVAFQLFKAGMVRDGNLVSKNSRNHLVENGYAVQYDGMQTLTGKGTIAFLTSWRVWLSAFRRWRRWGGNPFIADPERIRRARI